MCSLFAKVVEIPRATDVVYQIQLGDNTYGNVYHNKKEAILKMVMLNNPELNSAVNRRPFLELLGVTEMEEDL